ncbi:MULTISPECIES: LytTR family DNA-binding domain-containing protein [Bacillus cereus group]|uniref:LytTR family DNA-binding domain-containing protein n=1 Tax=Bacillus cereus group TaxID=86661 RepID=UPI00345A19B1
MEYKLDLPSKVVASRGNKKYLLKLSSILYFVYCDEKVKVVVEDDLEYDVKHSLHFWESKLLSLNFFRCHKGYIVNLEKVNEIVPSFNSTAFLVLEKHKDTVPVGRKYIKAFKEIVNW